MVAQYIIEETTINPINLILAFGLFRPSQYKNKGNMNITKIMPVKSWKKSIEIKIIPAEIKNK